MECNQLIQHLNQLDNESQHDNFLLSKTQLTPSKSKKVSPKHVVRSEVSIHSAFVFHVITERQERAFITDVINSTKNHIFRSTMSLPSEKHCNDSSKSVN